MKRIFLGVAAFIFASAAMAFGQQPNSVGAANPPATFNVKVINTQYFPGNINELRAKYELLNNEFKPQADKVQSIQQQMGQIESEIQTQGNIMKQEAVAAKSAQYEKLKLDLKQLQERSQADYEARMKEVVGPIFDKIDKFLENYAQQRSISLILDASNNQQNPILAFVGADADITQDFISEYNKVNPGPPPSNANPPVQNPANRPKPNGRP
jgi:Skp family chaperone for outer membrane proteins